MLRVEELPGPEPPDVPVAHRPSAVEREGRAAVRVLRELSPGRVAKGSRHAQMHDKRPPAGEPPEQVLAPAVERHDPVADQSPGDDRRVDRPRQARIDDLRGLDRRPLEDRGEVAPDRLDLWQLGHAAIVRTARAQ